jgi:hypothetical protein
MKINVSWFFYCIFKPLYLEKVWSAWSAAIFRGSVLGRKTPSAAARHLPLGGDKTLIFRQIILNQRVFSPLGGKYKRGKYLRRKSSLVGLGGKTLGALKLFCYFSVLNHKIMRTYDNH